jgi:hypothetical protein
MQKKATISLCHQFGLMMKAEHMDLELLFHFMLRSFS